MYIVVPSATLPFQHYHVVYKYYTVQNIVNSEPPQKTRVETQTNHQNALSEFQADRPLLHTREHLRRSGSQSAKQVQVDKSNDSDKLVKSSFP